MGSTQWHDQKGKSAGDNVSITFSRSRGVRQQFLCAHPCIKKGNIAGSCVYDGESQIFSSHPLREYSAKRRKTSSTQKDLPTTREELRSHIDVPKLFNASDFTRSNITAED
ncbi:hypothetical protein TW65_04882 [Stemphylium lycopersici]|nr:hypothetical protein TW65_04882 [Stemphylium lycopersici]